MPKPTYKTKRSSSSSNPKDKNKKGGSPKPKDKKKGGGGLFVGKRKREIVFDPEARKEYLRGFSERKRQRRAFGLAMQKIKDRKAKIEQRALEKKDELERVEQAEHQKEILLEDALKERMKYSATAKKEDEGGSDENCDEFDSDDDDEDDGTASKKKKENDTDVLCTKVYNDSAAETTWGGQVTVTTSVVELDDGNHDHDDDNDGNKGSCRCREKKSVDVAQKFAGNVQKYMTNLKGKMPGKKQKRDGSGSVKAKRKGKDGRADMQGMGGSANLKIAQKLLSKSKEKGLGRHGGGNAGHGKKGKKGKR